MKTAGQFARALALCSLISFLLVGCGVIPAPDPPVATPRVGAAELEARYEQISRDAIFIFRRLNVNNLAFVRQGLTPAKYQIALSFLIPEVQALAQQVVDVNAEFPGSQSTGLLKAVDPLSRAAGEFQRYVDEGQDGALAAAYSQLSKAHGAFDEFLGATAFAASAELLELWGQAGHIVIDAEPTAVSRVVLGPFASEEQARNVQAQASPHAAELKQNGSPTVWLGPFRVAAEARAIAIHWREKNVAAAVHEDSVYDFRANEVSPVQGRTWNELAWFHDMEILTHFIAVSPDGNVVLAGDTSGTIQRRTGEGEHRWTQTVSLPTYALAVTREGANIFAVGIGAQALDGEGGVIWNETLEESDVILEFAQISNDGRFMVAATTNADEMGQAFVFDQTGRVWVTPKELGVSAFHLSPDGSPIALGAVGQGRFHVLVLNERGEKIMGSDLSEPVLGVAIAGQNDKLVVLTERHVSQFDIASESIEWQMPVRGRSLAVSKPGDIIYVGGVHGISAYYQDGHRLWVQDAMPVTQIAANNDFLIGLSRDIRLIVVRFDGSVLGEVSSLVPIRDYAVAADSNLVVVLDEENRLSAWRLPLDAQQ
jgi:hypothetical protein